MISFIMLTWNREKFIEKMLASFFSNLSGKHPFELLVIDNGSTDGSRKILESHAQAHPEMRIAYNRTNKGLSEYKKLLNRAKGDYIVIVDDDVIEFPHAFDDHMVSCMETFPEFGFVALDVVQDEHTNGAKPGPESYRNITRGAYTIAEGPTGGWCTILRRAEFRKIRFLFNLIRLNMKQGEDGSLQGLFASKLKLRSGIIDKIRCYHAAGPYFSKLYGCIERDIKKYEEAKLQSFVDAYKNYGDEGKA